jgi:hypothetical protein
MINSENMVDNNNKEVFFLKDTEYVFKGQFEMLYEYKDRTLVATASFKVYNITNVVMPMFLN